MMVRVLFKCDSHYSVDRNRIRRLITVFLNEKGVSGDVEVSIAIVGDRMMRSLNTKFRNLDKTTNVLSFPIAEAELSSPFVEAPDNILRLGDIVLSYPQVRDQAATENKLVDDMMDELVTHGMYHLLGQHDYE